ncbi:chemotaxis response regulator protein-glutamate methylesterase [Pseudoalteromonas luteoviolacea]|uniref:protein-glutamate methylesterase/protein-glutamine glutaminase n=1 Tax=Pseudoalteromonas luteoviolacea TaxID=43657 RepID=UPI001B39519A|nr:chemotaxis response regulator protein-glutamate methylesterase [Pseudoalteromonas luteoviolacea]MBQ4809867.1 chemotaxis response regulator protein-glutamate methylesterase [Pseudoalteromonas luteoviolacea]
MISVFIVDDSAVMRQLVGEIINHDRELKLIGSAPDPILAERKMKMNWPDVILLDVEMPKMDGITFLKKIMQERPTPIIMCSALTQKHTETTMEALASGAVDVIAKPTQGLADFINNQGVTQIVDAIKAAGKAKVKPMRYLAEESIRRNHTADEVLPPPSPDELKPPITSDKVIAVGASTGGTEALTGLLSLLPPTTPPIVIVQHMPSKFTHAFAQRLNTITRHVVVEGETAMRLKSGHVYIAPGGKHMLVKRQGSDYYLEIRDGPLVSRHRPSVDVLFRSVAQTVGRNAIGVILTGMGDDGASGMLDMKQAGAINFAESESSCVVFGMPKEAIARGAVDKVYSLSNIPYQILKVLGC